MNVLAPISSIMTTKLFTVNPEDKLEAVKEIFDKHRIHHLPVVRYKKMVGLISKTDLLFFIKGLSENSFDDILNSTRLKNYTAQDIMTTGIAKMEPKDRINIALKVFNENLFHAIPIVEEEELVGIVTTYDIIRALSKEPVGNKYM
ncbi:MAG: acetoin utilization protein AcuB [Saprospiraceae bacterium]|jgi:acetoin utilization protein AcuB